MKVIRMKVNTGEKRAQKKQLTDATAFLGSEYARFENISDTKVRCGCFLKMKAGLSLCEEYRNASTIE
jgi:hypothetical protein